jgi:hypothetical protein
MKFEGTLGLIDFTAPHMPAPAAPGPGHVLDRVYKTPTMAGQWVKGTHGTAFDYVSISNVAAPNIPVDAKVQPTSFLRGSAGRKRLSGRPAQGRSIAKSGAPHANICTPRARSPVNVALTPL